MEIVIQRCPKCSQPMSPRDAVCYACGWIETNTYAASAFHRGSAILVEFIVWLIAAGFLFVGLNDLTQATLGVGLIAAGIWFLIGLRLLQSNIQHKKISELIAIELVRNRVRDRQHAENAH